MDWRHRRDPLYRGDHRGGVSLPTPTADKSLVRHILYLEGLGRETPYVSTTESRDTAAHFAGTNGQIYTTTAHREEVEFTYLPRKTLLKMLRGRGQGLAAWSDPFEVTRARQYVEQHAEHLFSFSSCEHVPEQELRQLVDEKFR